MGVELGGSSTTILGGLVGSFFIALDMVQWPNEELGR